MSCEYIYLMEDALESALAFGGLRSTLSLVAYVFSALSLYTIARRRGIGKAWLAWVPLVNVWILGSISDQYRYVVRGEVKNKRKVLLTLRIVSAVLSVAATIRLVVMAVTAFSGLAQGMAPGVLTSELLGGVLSGLLISIPMAGLGIVALVFEIMALYDVYTSCDPSNNVLYLILSIIPGINTITQPLFLFLCRDQDAGMPPRREDSPEL